MFLIDTSIWIDYFRKNSNKGVQFFENILDSRMPYGITAFIYQEILQGAHSITDYNRLAEYLSTQLFFHPLHPVNTYESAAKLYFNCRRKGITVRSTVDCLIARIAIEHELILVHHDHDFEHIQKIDNNLKLYA